MGSNKLPELGTMSYALSCSLSALFHPVQTRLSLSIPMALHLSTSWSMLMILLLQVVTPHLLTLFLGNLTLNSPPRILGHCLTFVELRF